MALYEHRTCALSDVCSVFRSFRNESTLSNEFVCYIHHSIQATGYGPSVALINCKNREMFVTLAQWRPHFSNMLETSNHLMHRIMLILEQSRVAEVLMKKPSEEEKDFKE
ncbi:hypothetical protein PR048_012080 [Dryococelus australis]|uniref:Uncharacterized protein n=1 Tax=Dryococelus australis TaxID=614101 RepID=A0ABQ9HNF4_9NEOP|nr:hypothetical protein PR048_012080 [Dryococelus australis]